MVEVLKCFEIDKTDLDRLACTFQFLCHQKTEEMCIDSETALH
jgi:hypothetical protein